MAEDVVNLTVRDTGPGIAADQLERIFEPFVQVRRSLVDAREGRGLGLAISRALSRDGAELRVESKLGRGSTFALRQWHRSSVASATIPGPSRMNDTPDQHRHERIRAWCISANRLGAVGH